MIPGEFLCDRQYLSAFTGRERWPISPSMSQKTYLRGFSVCGFSSVLWALYGTAKSRALRSESSSPPGIGGDHAAQAPRFQRRMTVKMKRLWGRILQGLLAILIVLYLGDWITLRVRTGAQASNSVPVEQFLRTPLKGQKEEFDYSLKH